jgi:hypothetical protein
MQRNEAKRILVDLKAIKLRYLADEKIKERPEMRKNSMLLLHLLFTNYQNLQ